MTEETTDEEGLEVQDVVILVLVHDLTIVAEETTEMTDVTVTETEVTGGIVQEIDARTLMTEKTGARTQEVRREGLIHHAVRPTGMKSLRTTVKDTAKIVRTD